MIGAGLHGHWGIVGGLLLNFAVTIILRSISVWAAVSTDKSTLDVNDESIIDYVDESDELEEWDNLKLKG